MAVDERRRRALHDALERQLGAEEAATMMELVPPVGWADVATKRDLDHLEIQMDAKFHGLEAKFHALEAKFLQEMNEQTKTFSLQMQEQTRTLFRTFILTNMGTMLTVAALAFGAARLA